MVVDGVAPGRAGLPGAAAGLGPELPSAGGPVRGALRALRGRTQTTAQTCQTIQ